ncbi:MAG TPA: hypothetical protein VM305_09505 [Candidatus Limnocylindrales bacterium]|nr:hypothetical protein [Candidatus Limnocylindrales bacterium]
MVRLRGRAAALIVLVALVLGAMPLNVAAAGSAAQVLEGVLERVKGDDFARGKAVGHGYVLSGRGGELTELAFARQPADKLVGKKVRLKGRQNGQTFNVAADGTQVVASTSTSGTSGTSATKRVAVILFNFANDQTQPYTTAFAAGIAFNNADSVAAYYSENSLGKWGMTGQVFGWYTIASSNSSCSYSTWANEARALAAVDGYADSQFDNVVYGFPRTSACSWNGLANLPGRNSWLNGTGGMTLRVMAHELGHNFGTHHAQTLSCTEGGVRVALVSDISKCTVSEYGDPFTVMGAAQRHHMTNFSRGNFGWLSNGNTADVSKTGEYLLAPLGVGSGVVGVRIARTSNSWLLLEYRRPYGTLFETYSSSSAVANGVSVRIVPAYSSRTQSKLVDTTPSTTSFSDAALASGGTFTDPLTNVSITTVSVASSGAVVRVQFGGSGGTSPSPSPTPSPTPSASPSPTPSPSPSTNPTPTLPPDTEPPTAPTDLTVAPAAKGNKVVVSWKASTDNIGVAGYRVFRNGTQVASVTHTSYSDSLPKKTTSPTYYVVAFDAAGNVSVPADPVAFRK